jgi:hypothetical protein
MGEVEAFEIYEYPGKKMIIKVKVAINVHQPIPSGIHVGNPTDGSYWVDFRYERLPQMCFNCGLVGHADTACRNRAMEANTLAPLGPWIRSSQYGRRKMEDKDKKFYSNPSQSPNFGHYSPPVPAALLAQLAAIKLQNQTPKDSAAGYKQQTQQKGPEQAKDKGKNEIHIGTTLMEVEMGNHQNNKPKNSAIQAKRLKLDYEGNNGRSDATNKQMASLGGKASQQI